MGETSTSAQTPREALEGFLVSWEQGGAGLEAVIDAEPLLDFSMFGEAYTPFACKGWLNRRAQGSKLLLRIVNYAERVCSAETLQYASVVGLLVGAGPFGHHYSFAGTFANELVSAGSAWRLKVMRFDLQCDDTVSRAYLTREGVLVRESGFGDASLACGWYGIDDRVGHNMRALPHAGTRAISPDYDPLWLRWPEKPCAGDDAGQCVDAVYRCCAGFDLAVPVLFADIFASNVELNCADGTFKGRRAVIAYLKQKRKTLPRSHHSLRIDEAFAEAGAGHVAATRIAPDAKASRAVPEALDEAGVSTWEDARYRFDFAQQEGVWHIERIACDAQESMKAEV